jgi:hypothetical protein
MFQNIGFYIPLTFEFSVVVIFTNLRQMFEKVTSKQNKI